MIHLQRNTPPIDEHVPFTYSDFSGGLNNKTELKLNQARDLLNMSFLSDLRVGKRTGVYKDEDFIATFHDITFIDRYYRQGTRQWNTVYADKDRFCVDIKIYNIPNVTMGVGYKDQYFFVNGEAIWVMDGLLTVRKMVNPPAGFTPAPSPATIGIWVNDDSVNPKERWYEPCQLELDSTELGTNLIPDGPTIIALKEGRLYVSGVDSDPNNVYISDLDNGFYWPVALPLQAPPNGEKVTCLYEFMNTMVIGRENSIYAIYGNTNIPDSGDDLFRVKSIQTHAGIINSKCVARMHNYMVFVGSDGIVYYMITPLTDVRYFTTKVLSKDVDLFKEPLGFTYEQIEECFATFSNNEYLLSINDKTLIYNYVEQAWTVYDVNVASMLSYNDELKFTLKGATGFYKFREHGHVDAYRDVIKINFTNDIENNAINSYWTSLRDDFGNATYFKHFREIFLVVSTFKNYISNVDVNFEIDYIDVGNLITIADKIAVWGRAVFGDRLLDKDISVSLPTQIGRRGRFLSFTVSNNSIDQPLVLHEMSGDYILRGRRK